MKLKCLVGLHDHDWSLIRLDRDRGRFFVECKHCKWFRDGLFPRGLAQIIAIKYYAY